MADLIGSDAARAVSEAINAGLSYARVAHPDAPDHDARTVYAVRYACEQRLYFAGKYRITASEYERMLRHAYGFAMPTTGA